MNLFLENIITFGYIILIIINSIIVIRLVTKIRKEQKNIPKWKREESKRYFNGSAVDIKDFNPYQTRVHTSGLSCIAQDGKIIFRKTGKIADTGLLY